jgi:hypothetical protein
MRLGRLDDRNVQRFWSAAAQARRDSDAGSAPANDQDLMVPAVSHETSPVYLCVLPGLIDIGSISRAPGALPNVGP